MPTPFQVRGMPNAPSGGLTPYIQRGTINVSGSSATATISSVNTAKCELRYLGLSYANATLAETLCQISLTNSTTITATRGVGGNAITVSWELTEWK